MKNAVSLVPTLGFTRTTISQAALSISYQEGMSDRSIDALFGRGDEARKTLIRAWLEEGRNAMRIPDAPKASVRDSLQKRLEWNIPVLDKLPEVGYSKFLHPIWLTVRRRSHCWPLLQV